MSKNIMYAGLAILLLAVGYFGFSQFGSKSVPMGGFSTPKPNAEVVAVFGATGRTGKQVSLQLLQAGQYKLRAVVRDVDKAKDIWGGDSVEVFNADVTDSKAVAQAMKGVSGVIIATGPGGNFKGSNSPEAVDYNGVKNIIAAADANDVKHIVFISSWGVTHIENSINKNLHNVLIWKYLGEEELRKSDINYTIVRPGSLFDEAGGKLGIEFSQGDKLNGAGISREDVAQVCVHALFNKAAYQKTFEIINTQNSAELINWEAEFAKLKADAD